MFAIHIMASYLLFPQNSYKAGICQGVTSNVPSLSTSLNPNPGKYLQKISWRIQNLAFSLDQHFSEYGPETICIGSSWWYKIQVLFFQDLGGGAFSCLFWSSAPLGDLLWQWSGLWKWHACLPGGSVRRKYVICPHLFSASSITAAWRRNLP